MLNATDSVGVTQNAVRSIPVMRAGNSYRSPFVVPASWRNSFALLFLFLTLVCYGIAVMAPAVGTFHDDGIYLVTAKALAEGKGYKIISLPSEIPQTKFPPLFPLILATIWKINPEFPSNLLLLKAVPFAFAILWCALVYLLVWQETGSPDAGRWIALFTLASPAVIYCATTTLSETMFASLCTGALLCLHRYENRAAAQRNAMLLGASVLAAAAFLTRTAALPLVPAGMLMLLIRHKYKPALAFLVLFSILVFPWIAWQHSQQASATGPDGFYSWSSYPGGTILASFDWHQKLVIAGKNLLFTAAAPGVLLGVAPGKFLFVAAILLNTLALCGFLYDLRHGLSVMHVFLILYLGMLLTWAYPPARFMIPVLPLVLLFAYKGLLLLIPAAPDRYPAARIVRRVLIVALALCLTSSLLFTAMNAVRYGAVYLPYDQGSYDWQELQSLLVWMRREVRPDAIVLSHLDPVYYLYTGHRGFRGLAADPFLLFYADSSAAPLGTASDLIRVISQRNVAYVVRTPEKKPAEGAYLNEMLAALEQNHPQVLRPVHGDYDSAYRIYAVDSTELCNLLKSTDGQSALSK